MYSHSSPDKKIQLNIKRLFFTFNIPASLITRMMKSQVRLLDDFERGVCDVHKILPGEIFSNKSLQSLHILTGTCLFHVIINSP